ncbi:hypothetical protein OCU04_012837 [Sclerotinia nivalis]|uniref:Uncharacterized protein n=1 Tax=Sclerotinia nivalis TaxID=352851 RepID=A0A9X0A9T2_9HELO|nr:hypothetical protein OCU04_012837 [Sclerotinia nivalis]
MSHRYENVPQTNNPTRTPASSASVQPSSGAYQDPQQATQPGHTATSSASYQPSDSIYQNVQQVPRPHQLVRPEPAATTHSCGITATQLRDAQDRYHNASSTENPARYSAAVPGDVAGERKSRSKGRRRGKSRSRSGSKNRDCLIL